MERRSSNGLAAIARAGLRPLSRKASKLLLHSSNLLSIPQMEVKLSTHVYSIISMTTTNKNSLGQCSSKLLLHSSNLLSIAHMEVKLGTHVYSIVSMTTTNLRQCSSNYFCNLLSIAHMEVKRGTHVYTIVSMTTTNKFCLKYLIVSMTTMYKKIKNPMDYKKEGI